MHNSKAFVVGQFLQNAAIPDMKTARVKLASRRRRVLSIAGLDPSGGAGSLADLGVIQDLGEQPQAIISALTVQSSAQLVRSQPVPPLMLAQQLGQLRGADAPDAVKIGALGHPQTASVIASWLQLRPIPAVWDPVQLASSGGALNAVGALEQACTQLLHQIDLVCPNHAELELLLRTTGRRDAADLARAYGTAVLVTGGDQRDADVHNCLFVAGGVHHWSWPRRTGRFRGTGCTLSSAIAVALARGLDLLNAVAAGQDYTQRAIAAAQVHSPGLYLLNRVGE